MRLLLLTMGAPASGKSTWIKENGLDIYTLEPDRIRMMYQSPLVDLDGRYYISQENDRIVWETLFQILEERMKRGEFTVIDATHSRSTLINRYKKLADKYRYRIIVVDFRDEFTLEELIENDYSREPYKRVGEDVIRRIYARLKTVNAPSGIEVIKPEEYEEKILLGKLFYDFTDLYERIAFIGDIHSMFTELKVLFDLLGENDRTLYIFLGDYFDRGFYPVETFEFIEERMKKKNYIFLTGNHDLKLYLYEDWLEGNKVDAGKPTVETFLKFKEAKITPKRMRQFLRKLGQIVFFKFYDFQLFGNHAGFPFPPSLFDAANLFIEGIGTYSDDIFIKEKWSSFADREYKVSGIRFVQVHGHRNVLVGDKWFDRYYVNLTGNPSAGSSLKAVTFTKDRIDTFEVPVIDYKNVKSNFIAIQKFVDEIDEKDLYRVMKDYPGVNVKEVWENLYSINFSKKTFYRRNWDEIRTKARGLFVYVSPETEDSTIVARSYDKFFNIGERRETRFDILVNSVEYPIYVHEKVNGFLGMLTVWNGELLFATKSSLSGKYVQYFKDVFYNLLTEDEIEEVKKILSYDRVTAVFEVIDPVNDPHIVEYKEKNLYLLDVVENTVKQKFNNDLYYELRKFFIAPEQYAKIKTPVEFKGRLDWLYSAYKPFDIENYTEGYVLTSKDGTKVKVKTDWYRFWRWAREFMSNNLRRKNTPVTNQDIANWQMKMHQYEQYEFLNWIINRPDLWKDNIIKVRKEFFNDRHAGKSEETNIQN